MYKGDITKKREVDSMAGFCIHTFGSIDVLINNAGIAAPRLFMEISEAEWDEMLNVNLKGVFHCSQAALLKKGKIINIASIFGQFSHQAGHQSE